MCSMAYRAPQSLTEKVLLNFLGKILSEWPEWMAQTFAALQKAVADAAKQVPATVETDEPQLGKVQKQLERLVDALASGSQQSQAIMTRVKQMELESETLQKSIADARKLLTQSIDLPDEAWLRSQMQDLAEVLRGEPGRAAFLLRAIIGKVTINAVIGPHSRAVRLAQQQHRRPDFGHEYAGRRVNTAVPDAAGRSTRSANPRAST